MSGAVHSPGSLPLRKLNTDIYNNIIDYLIEKGVEFRSTGGSKYALQSVGGQTNVIEVTLYGVTKKMFEEVLLIQLKTFAREANYILDRVIPLPDWAEEAYKVRIGPWVGP